MHQNNGLISPTNQGCRKCW